MPAIATLDQNIATWKLLHERGYFEHHPRYQDRLHDLGVEPITKRINLDPSHTLLEIGCGYGRLLWHLAPLVRDVIGVEVAPEPISAAHELLAQRAPGRFSLHLGDGATLAPIKDDTVDRAVVFTVFQHLSREGVGGYLGELARVLRPGGLACMQFFCRPGGQTDFKPDHREQSISMSAADVTGEIELAGLRIESIDRDDLSWYGHSTDDYWWWWAVASKPR